MKRLFVIAIAATTAMTAMPAQAETVNFYGNRIVECSVTGYTTNVSFGNLGRKGEASDVNDNNIDLFCNQPFKITVNLQNGYMKLQGNAANASFGETNLVSQGNPGFNAGLDYVAHLPFIGNVSSASVNAGTYGAYGPFPAQNITGQTVSYSTVPTSNPLLGGEYRDTVTLTLTPQGV